MGLNGAGKTTLVKLLCGLSRPRRKERVLLNGADIGTFEPARTTMRACSARCSRNNSLLPGYGGRRMWPSSRRRITDAERVWTTVSKRPGLTEFVSRPCPRGCTPTYGKELYPDGVASSPVDKPSDCMLARALYKDGPILMLDEPTAALDPIAEDDIYQKYSAMTQGKTSVFISHRLASTRFCDRILFLDHGRIAEEGTHEALLAKNGGYAALFEVQSRYYQEGREF